MTPQVLVAWLVGSLALSVVVVGCGTITSRERRSNPTISNELRDGVYFLSSCTMANGGAGYQFDDLCLSAPPIGWTGPKRAIAKAPVVHGQQPGRSPHRSHGIFFEL